MNSTNHINATLHVLALATAMTALVWTVTSSSRTVSAGQTAAPLAANDSADRLEAIQTQLDRLEQAMATTTARHCAPNDAGVAPASGARRAAPRRAALHQGKGTGTSTPRAMAARLAQLEQRLTELAKAPAMTRAQREALQEVKKARDRAENGDTGAMISLGLRYRDGRLVERSDEDAVVLFEEALAHGDVDAADHLAWMVEQGRGTERSIEEAEYLYRLAAERGIPQAQANLGRILSKRADADPVEAYTWLALGVRGGRSWAASLLAKLAPTLTVQQRDRAELLVESWKPTVKPL